MGMVPSASGVARALAFNGKGLFFILSPFNVRIWIHMENPEFHTFMREAIKEARLGLSEGGIPIGSVMVKDGKIIGRGRNKRVQEGSQIRHSEMDCLENAGRMKNFEGVTLYSTLMPCYMCSGAIIGFNIKRVVVGESENFSEGKEFLKDHGVEVIDLDLEECKTIMAEFIKNNPSLWKEDIAE